MKNIFLTSNIKRKRFQIFREEIVHCGKRFWILPLVIFSFVLTPESCFSQEQKLVFSDAKIIGPNEGVPGEEVWFDAIGPDGQKMHFWTQCPSIYSLCSRLIEVAANENDSLYKFSIFYYRDMDKFDFGEKYSFAYGLEFRGMQFDIVNGQRIHN